MGRYISTGTAQVNSCTSYSATTCYQVSSHKYSYDANECWPNRIIIDTPGNYTFTVPSGATCIRAIGVGGGGKPKCVVNCQNFAGAGGAYVEKFDGISAGCTVTIVVGRQEQDTTISYVCSGGGTRTLTAGGAAGCIPGVASGGDWNSSGGCAGAGCNYCGGSVSHYCGTCTGFAYTTCCGYCIVLSGVGVTYQPDHTNSECCNARYPGGGSAGSWIWSTGGAGQGASNTNDIIGNNTGGASAGGGGGIGYIQRETRKGAYCSCICAHNSTGYNDGGGRVGAYRTAYPTGAGGGGGTKWQCWTNCETIGMIGQCMGGVWRSGPGGLGGFERNEGSPDTYYWGYFGTYCSWDCIGKAYYQPPGPDPVRHQWHDIHSMCGSGAAGRQIAFHGSCWGTCGFATQAAYGPMPSNSGEGAGTGAVVFLCCNPAQYYQQSSSQFFNWNLICCLGTSNKVCCSDRFEQQLFMNILSCAGTLGGSGGVGLSCMASKAGKGGGAGQYRCYIICVCYGGTYNTCNGDGVTQLAYPPSELDWRMSTAGTGMAIIYWK